MVWLSQSFGKEQRNRWAVAVEEKRPAALIYGFTAEALLGAVFSWAGRIKFLESRLLRQCSSPTIGDEGTSIPPHPMEVDQLPGSLGQTIFWTAGAAGLTEAYSSERAARCAMNSCYFLRSCFIAACPIMSVNVCPNLQAAVTVLDRHCTADVTVSHRHYAQG